jgi:hypothetical protein
MQIGQVSGPDVLSASAKCPCRPKQAPLALVGLCEVSPSWALSGQ